MSGAASQSNVYENIIFNTTTIKLIEIIQFIYLVSFCEIINGFIFLVCSQKIRF